MAGKNYGVLDQHIHAVMQSRVRFFIITYHRPTDGDVSTIRATDRFEIDLELNISTDFTERRTYVGIHGFSQFDLSFRVAGECGENYYGPRCNKFCLEEGGELACDSEGNTVCENSNFDLASNCTECLVMGRDVANNCEEISTTTTTIGVFQPFS